MNIDFSNPFIKGNANAKLYYVILCYVTFVFIWRQNPIFRPEALYIE